MNYKKIILIPIMFLCFHSFAQIELNYGFKFGSGTSKLKFNEIRLHQDGTLYKIYPQNNTDIGAHFGIFLRAKKNNKYLQSELLYTYARGGIIDYEREDNGYPGGGIGTNYFLRINMPIIFGLQGGPFALQAGPVLSYLTYKDSKVSIIYLESDNKFSLAYQIGLEINIKSFFISARYENNIIPIVDYATYKGQKFDDYNLTIEQFMFSIGFIMGRQKISFKNKNK